MVLIILRSRDFGVSVRLALPRVLSQKEIIDMHGQYFIQLSLLGPENTYRVYYCRGNITNTISQNKNVDKENHSSTLRSYYGELQSTDFHLIYRNKNLNSI